jgi:hypothetical protein
MLAPIICAKRMLSSLGLLFMILFRIGRAEKLRYINMGSILIFQVPTLVSPMLIGGALGQTPKFTVESQYVWPRLTHSTRDKS